jgi:hypothetical protein
MKLLRIAAFAICSLLAFGSADAQHRSTSLAVLIIAAGNIASPTEDITRGNRTLITRVGTIRTQEPAINIGVTGLESPVNDE